MANLSKRIAAEHRQAICKEIGSRMRKTWTVADEPLPEAMVRMLAKLQAKTE
jgi:hypothetical protein